MRENLHDVHAKPLDDTEVTEWCRFTAAYNIGPYFPEVIPQVLLPALITRNDIMTFYKPSTFLLSSNEAPYNKPYSCKMKSHRTSQSESNNSWNTHLQMYVWSADIFQQLSLRGCPISSCNFWLCGFWKTTFIGNVWQLFAIWRTIFATIFRSSMLTFSVQ